VEILLKFSFDDPHTATNLMFTMQPSNGAAASTLPAVIVQVQDAYGNLVVLCADRGLAAATFITLLLVPVLYSTSVLGEMGQ
jgi:hypothetical protein